MGMTIKDEMVENIFIFKGDITRAETDIIVNAANQTLLGGGGVDGAIHRCAGKELLEACKQIKIIKGNIRCSIGDARITPAFNLKAKYIIHTVGPRYNIDKNPEELLKSAYEQSLKLALSYQVKSIAFPAISCGVYRYPKEEAAKISLSVCSERKYSKLNIYFYLFNEEIYRIWLDVLEYLHCAGE